MTTNTCSKCQDLEKSLEIEAKASAAECAGLRRRIAELEEALRFYADENNWDKDCAISYRKVSEGVEHDEYDLGETARKALGEE